MLSSFDSLNSKFDFAAPLPIDEDGRLGDEDPKPDGGMEETVKKKKKKKKKKKANDTTEASIETSNELEEQQCPAVVEAMDDAELPAAFQQAMMEMPLYVRELICFNGDPSGVPVATLLHCLKRTQNVHHKNARRGDVLSRRACLSPHSCMALRRAVDRERSSLADTVDGFPEHQHSLSGADALEALIGVEEARRLWRLPAQFHAQFGLGLRCRRHPDADDDAGGDTAAADAPNLAGSSAGTSESVAAARAAVEEEAEELRERARSLRFEARALRRCGDEDTADELVREATAMDAEAKLADAAAKSDTFETPSEEALEAKGRAALKEAFVRRYTLDTRPWNPFHTDRYEITCNVELSAGGAESYSGGVLLGLYDGEVRRITREEGEATLHSSKLLHAVTKMTSGTRYSLILFFDRMRRTS